MTLKETMKISVLGCGWLGFPLAQSLLDEGYAVNGSTTTKEKTTILKQAGIDPWLIKLPDGADDQKNDPFWDCDLLFFNLPPKRGDKDAQENYLKSVRTVIEKVKKHNISWIIFASSTSVYPDRAGITEETDTKPGNASRPSGETILEAERLIQTGGVDWTILRFGGLYGYGRHPVKYLSGRNGLSGASRPVNLVHQVDCVRAVSEVIRQKKRNTVYNVVSDGHPPRKEFYESAARHFGLEEPEFSDAESTEGGKVISNQKLKEELLFTFSYPNPMDHTP